MGPDQGVAYIFPGQKAPGKARWDRVPAKVQKGGAWGGGIHSSWLYTCIPALAHGCLWGASLCRCMGVCEARTH